MTLVRTLVAHCDCRHPGTGCLAHSDALYPCGAIYRLRPTTSQPYQDLVARGWSTETSNRDVKIYCPACTMRRANSQEITV